MDINQIKHVIEAALLAAGRPLSFDKIASLFTARGSELEKATIESALAALAADYEQRGLELKEVSSGYRVQIRKSMSDWLTPLWEERAPRYTRALLETLALVAYRQPITRAEIEEVRGVAVSTNIMRTLLERNWVRVVGHRDVPGKPAMFGTTRDFLDYFGLKRLEDLPPLADVKDGLPELSPQTDLVDALEIDGEAGTTDEAEVEGGEVQAIVSNAASTDTDEEEEVSFGDEDSAAPEAYPHDVAAAEASETSLASDDEAAPAGFDEAAFAVSDEAAPADFDEASAAGADETAGDETATGDLAETAADVDEVAATESGNRDNVGVDAAPEHEDDSDEPEDELALRRSESS